MDKLQKVVSNLESNDPVKVSNALNYLTQKSMEVSGDSVAPSSLQLDALPFLPTVIGSLLDTINPLGNILFQYPTRLDVSNRMLLFPYHLSYFLTFFVFVLLLFFSSQIILLKALEP